MVSSEQPGNLETQVLRQLNEFYLSASLGDYFRSRVHGWLSLRAGSSAALPADLAERLGPQGSSARIVPSDTTPEQLAIDAFALAYHVSETYCRQVLAGIQGVSSRSSPAIVLKLTPTGRSFSEDLAKIVASDEVLDSVIDFLFLPMEVRGELSEEAVGEHRRFLREWSRHHVLRLDNWKNPYNAFKHGLAATAPPTEIAFVADPLDEAEQAHPFMKGHVLHTLEQETLRQNDGAKLTRLSWWHRAIDPVELIADVLVSAQILDWLKVVAGARLLNQPAWIPRNAGPRPAELRSAGPPGISLRMDVGAVPLQFDDVDRQRISDLLDGQGSAGSAAPTDRGD